MDNVTRRVSGVANPAIATAVANSDPIDIREFASGAIVLGANTSLTTLTYYGAATVDGLYSPAQDAAGAAVVQTVAASKAYPIPAILFGFAYIKIVGNAADHVAICLKS